MARTCTICRHPERNEIDRALVAGEPYRGVARLYKASESAVYRHQQGHLVKAMVKAHDAQEVAHGDSLVDQLQSLQQRALGILTEAERSGDHRTALAAIRESRGCLELGSKLAGQLVEQHEHGAKNIFHINVLQEVFQTVGDELKRLNLNGSSMGPVFEIPGSEALMSGEEAQPGFGDFESPVDAGNRIPLRLRQS